jgi:hypothetical protein
LGKELGKGRRCGVEKPYNTVNGAQWAILVRTQKGKIVDRKANTKLCYKVQIGTRTLLGTSLQAM